MNRRKNAGTRGLRLRRCLVVTALLCAFSSCDNSRSRIVGKWKVVGDSSETIWEFTENGNVSAGGAAGRYTFGDGQRIKIQTPAATFVHQLEFAGDRMIWNDPDGTKTELTKVK